MAFDLHEQARPEGLEPPTLGLEVRRSIQLSYGRRCCNSRPSTGVPVRWPCGEPPPSSQERCVLSESPRRRYSTVIGEQGQDTEAATRPTSPAPNLRSRRQARSVSASKTDARSLSLLEGRHRTRARPVPAIVAR